MSAKSEDRIAAVRPTSARISVDAPRERVFALLSDLAVRPAFMGHLFEDYHLLREQPVGVGAGARFRVSATGGWLDSVIVEAEPPHRLIERGHGGRLNRVPNVIEWTLVDGPGGRGCEVSVTFWTEPEHPFDRLRELGNSSRRLARGLRRGLERLREVAEDDAPPERAVVAGGDRLTVPSQL